MRRLALAVAGLAVALLAVELGVRVLAPQPVGAAASHPLLRGPLDVPGDHPVRTAEYDVVVHVNARGFVDREWGAREGRRVVVIGDSFVQAAQVPLDAGYGRVLDGLLPDAEVLSMGVPGAGTATALGVLEAYALPERPDVVVLGFLVANDVMNNHPLLEGKDDKPFYALRDGELVLTDAAASLAPRGLLWEASHLFRWVSRTLATREATRRKLALGGGLPVEHRVHDPSPDPTWEEAWAVTDALVAALAARCEAAGVRFATVLFPDATQVYGARYPEMATWDLTAAQARAGALAGAHGPVLDLLPAFRAGGPGLYFEADGHWTIAGHRLAAEATAPFVADILTSK
ncbi:MAG: alginate O-acetyltransferase AlgX-related protein [Myxococcota bacterium]